MSRTHTKSTEISVKLLHGNLSDEQFRKIMKRIAKAAQARSQRSVGVFCGSESTWLWGKDKADK